MSLITCHHCGRKSEKSAGAVKRASKAGLNLYCDRTCAGLARRKSKTKTQKVEEKRLYDIEYRRKNRARLKAEKRAYFKRTYDPVKAAIERKANMARHVEYCRRPEYRVKKKAYDSHHRAKRMFGPFAESFLLLQEIETEIASRMSKYDIYLANGTLNKRLERKREYARLIRG